MKIVKALKGNELFKNMKEEKIEEIISKITYHEREYHRGEVIAHEDEKCNSLGLIISGCIEIIRLYSSGKSITIQKLGVGDVFGEALVFSSHGNYPATIEAVEKTNIIFINKEEVLKLCLEEKLILENFMTLLSDKVFMLNGKIKSISFKSLKQRVINYLIQKSRTQKSLVIKLKDSKESIAAYLGMPRPSLSRELIKLRDEELITFDRNTITILNIDDLEEELFE
ncbi:MULTISPECIES: Crp/Fnr family transcriptional regulator [Clostridium]|uniref:Crp/Fnr family transcriptional regulator n=1 Tax=Clostridium cibarium TaxID=2762247 RepID=A0ABR8PTU1_9CLOT|nr:MULTISPECIES: Crp/Fnr family transcriptional regulator [Clostridium]MBD7911558.1 Crp/Fnr family transcriptional regulator [Clostridium cibarium]